MQKIDFVVRWVDGNDEVWQKEKKKYQLLEKVKQENEDATGQIRYRDYGLMKYWFRGIEKYAPWVNRVYFVTNGQKPEWLNEECPKLRMVFHEEFIPKEWLPTFSSRTIDFNLHRLPGLSEQFVVFDDDMFLVNAVRERDFFEDGLPCDSKVYNIITALASSFPSSVFCDMQLINKYFVKNQLFSKAGISTLLRMKYGLYLYKNIVLSMWNYYPGFQDFHIAYSFLKSTFFQIWNKEELLLSDVCKAKFRKPFSPGIWLFRYWQLAGNCFFPRNCNFGKYLVLSDDTKTIEKVLFGKKYKTMCINDAEVRDFDSVQARLQQIFECKFPDKSMFER